MLFLLSPAKNLNEDRPAPTAEHSQPQLLADAQELMQTLKSLSAAEIAELMQVSEKIAALNAKRNAAWQTPFTPANAKQALYLFDGDVYEGLDAASLKPESITYLQENLRILSGLYGLLRPLDLIQPYRLEMGRALANCRGKNLYEFWGSRIGDLVADTLQAQGSDTLINLASQEYAKALRLDKAQANRLRIITPQFKDEKNGRYKIISFYAKRARGLMVRYAAERGIRRAEELKAFRCEGYRFDADASSEQEWVFLRAQS